MLNNGKGDIQNLSLDDTSQLNFSQYKATLSNLRQAYVLRGISWFLFFLIPNNLICLYINQRVEKKNFKLNGITSRQIAPQLFQRSYIKLFFFF